MRFNLSHSGDFAFLAIGLGRAVGIDLEQLRAIDPVEVAGRFFARNEINALERLDAQTRIEAFFRCWTRKEAVIKAMGAGLTFPLDAFSVCLDEDPSSQVLQTCTVAPEALASWRIVSLKTDPGYHAAVAAGMGEWQVIEWDIVRV
jgi:4'-phosphopantetheinyl transferase